jgi:hypothetical protein
MKINKEDTMEIGRTHNGYLLKTYFTDTDGEGKEFINSDLEVFQFNNDEEEKEKLTQLLYQIAENLGVVNDKYGTDNLAVEFGKKGSKANE